VLYRRVFFDFQTGDSFEEVTSLVKFDDFTFSIRAGSDTFHYSQNVANISLVYDAAIYTKIMGATNDIIVKIIDTDETASDPIVYTPLFQGHIAPSKSHSYDGIIDNVILNLEALDDGDYLDKEIGDICYRHYTVMNPASPETSIVHQLAYIAGFTVGQIDGSVTIPVELNAYSPPSTSDTIKDLLDTVLFEYGYVLHFNELGQISPTLWMHTDAVDALTFNEDNVLDGSFDIADGLKEYDGAEITYYELGEGITTSGQTDILLYRDGDLPYASDGSFLGYAVLSGYTYPPLTNVIDETTGNPTLVYQKYEDTAIKYWTNKAITERLDYNYKAFTSDFSSIVATSGWYLDYSADAGVELITSEFENTQARIVFSGLNNDANLLYYCNVYGKILYKTSERVCAVTTISGSEDLDKYVSTFIFEKEHADILCKFLALQHSTNNLNIDLESEQLVEVGELVYVITGDGTNELCYVAERKYTEKTKLYTYSLRSYMYGDEVTLPALTSQSVTSPSRINGVTSSSTPDAKEMMGGALFVSTTNIVRNRLEELTPSGISMYARYAYDGTDYLGRFTVELSHDGVTYQDPVYTSASDETSYVYAVPTTMIVTASSYYVASVRIRLYPTGGVGVYKQQALCAVTADPSIAPMYLGIGILSALGTMEYEAADVNETGDITVIGAFDQVYVGDTVVNYSATGGVATLGMFKWNGSAWVKTTSIKDLTPAMNDLFGLSVAGISIADATVLSLLIAKQILAENVDVTGQLTVQAGGRMRYETGAGVQKRCVQLADEKIDWLDTPDTTPASAEQLRFRFGRLGVSGAVLADGEFYTNCDQGLSAETIIKTSTGYSPAYRFDAAGDLWIGYGIYEKKYSAGAWGTEVSTASDVSGYKSGFITLQNGDGLLVYIDYTASSLKQCLKIGGIWGTPTTIRSVSFSSHVAAVQENNGAIRVVYQEIPSLKIFEIVNTGSGFGTPVEIVASASLCAPAYLLATDGTLRLAYSDASGYLTEIIYTTTWSSASVITSAASGYPAYYQKINGSIYIAYRREADGYIVEKMLNSTWGSESVLNAASSNAPALIQQINGDIHFAYTTTDLVERIHRNYARVGGGFIAKGATDYTLFDGAKITVSGTSLTGYIGPQGPTGPTGDQGEQGIQGDAATIAVGTVVPGDSPEDASVINSGTSGDAVFDFTLPKGDPGTTVPDISALTVCTDPDPVNDSLIIYDASAGSHKRLAPEKAFSPPIGFIYAQFPGKSDPATLFGLGTWSNVSSSFAGDFFRAEGGNAGAFKSGEQAQMILNHVHTTYMPFGNATAGSGAPYQVRAASNIVASYNASSGNPTVNGGVENRPANQTIRIWERTA